MNKKELVKRVAEKLDGLPKKRRLESSMRFSSRSPKVCRKTGLLPSVNGDLIQPRTSPANKSADDYQICCGSFDLEALDRLSHCQFYSIHDKQIITRKGGLL